MAELLPYLVSDSSMYLLALRERVIRAEVWLRMVASGAIPIDPVVEAAAAVGTPSYSRPEVGESVFVRGDYE